MIRLTISHVPNFCLWLTWIGLPFGVLQLIGIPVESVRDTACQQQVMRLSVLCALSIQCIAAICFKLIPNQRALDTTITLMIGTKGIQWTASCHHQSLKKTSMRHVPNDHQWTRDGASDEEESAENEKERSFLLRAP